MKATASKTRLRRQSIAAEIARVADDIAARFRPRKIVLFGSHAGGKATADSDVDLLVVFSSRQPRDASVRIRRELECDFPMDLIVIDEARLTQRLAWKDFFLTEIMEGGKVLYESART
jgi:predicted nucleotidyltransferase